MLWVYYWWAKLHIDKCYRYDNSKSIAIAGSKGQGNVTMTTNKGGGKTVKVFPASKRYSIAYLANPSYSISTLKSK